MTMQSRHFVTAAPFRILFNETEKGDELSENIENSRIYAATVVRCYGACAVIGRVTFRSITRSASKMRAPLGLPIFLLLVLAACTDSGGYILEAKSSEVPTPRPENKELVLPLEVDQHVAENFVRIGFGLNKDQRFQSTEFLTPRLRTSQAAPLIRLVKQYNDFDGERVAQAVEKLKGRVSGVEFGREGSPVIYLELPYWTNQREEATSVNVATKISDVENSAFVEELKSVFESELKADEFTVNRRRVRIWWD